MPEKNHNPLKVTLTSDLEIVLTRTFQAPRKLVFEAWTTPERVVQWWGLKTTTLPVCEIDLRVGGAWRYVLRLPEGQEFGFHGVYQEIVAPERLAYTSVFEPMRGDTSLSTVTFAEKDGQTIVSETVLHQSKAGRDAHYNSAMEKGAAETLDRLADHLKTMV